VPLRADSGFLPLVGTTNCGSVAGVLWFGVRTKHGLA
jgi:hypothetical protein